MTITSEEINQLLDSVPIIDEPEISFPQADSFERVINLCELLNEHPMTKDNITINYAFDERQTNYYTDAARYLGLVVKLYYHIRFFQKLLIYGLVREKSTSMKLLQ